MTLRNLTELPVLRYLDVCNVLYIWSIRAIPTYRVYRLYDYSPSPTLWYMLVPVDSGEVDSIDVPGVVGVGQVTGVQVGVRQS